MVRKRKQLLPWTNGKNIRFFIRYVLISMVAVAAATLGTATLISINNRLTFALFYAAVMISAWYGGLIPGLLATFLAALVSNYFFLKPLYTLRLDFVETIQIGAFILVALLISSLTRARQQTEAMRRESSQQWRVTLASIGDAVITTDVDGQITFLNAGAEQLTGWSQAEAVGRPLDEVFRVVDEASQEPVENPVSRIIRENKAVDLANHTVLISRDGQVIPIGDSGAPIVDDRGRVTGVVLVFRDVSERRRAREMLEQQAAALEEQAHLIDLAHNSIMVWDRDDRIIFWNRGAEETYGWSEAEALNQDVHHLLQTQFSQPLEEIQAQLLREEQWNGELVQARRDGVPIIVASRWAIIERDTNGNPLKTLEINADITELKRTEQAQRLLAQVGQVLATSLDYEQTLTNLAQLAVPRLADWCTVDVLQKDGTVERLAVSHVEPDKVELARELYRRYPPNPDAPHGLMNVLRTGQSEIYPEVTDEMLRASSRDEEHLRMIRELRLTSTIIVPLVTRKKAMGAITFVWAESGHHYSQTDLALAEEVARRAALAMDNALLYSEAQEEIRARKQVEDRLKVSLTEKEVLLKEVHHRVKNNLQAVSNLLYLQAASIKDKPVRDMFQQTQDRIKSIALIHEKLYQTEDLSRVDFADYISGLATHLIHSYRINPETIELKIEVDDINLDVDTAVPLGVIINELVSNSLKHAFTPTAGVVISDQTAEIDIRMKRLDNEDQLLLTVRDNGRGIGEDAALATTESLGLQLVNLLTSYMKGTVEVEQNDGMVFKIKFPLSVITEENQSIKHL